MVVTLKDKVLPPDNQIALARRIPGATIHDIEAGHAACVLEADRFVPALLEAVDTVNARRRDFSRRTRAFFFRPLIGVGAWAATAALSVASSAGKRCTRSSTSGIDSRQAMIPTCTWPLLDITVMFSPAPWKTGPSG